MNWIVELFTNRFLITGLSSWLIAQLAKTVIHFIVYKKFDITRLLGDGGMPSGHSATVSSLAIMTALVYGVGSFEFAVTAILATIVCHDAMSVRREAGKQAVVLNEIYKSWKLLFESDLNEVKLKEFLGHTPVQVFVGILLGVCNAVVLYFILP